MDIHGSIFPETIKVREGFNSDSKYQVGVSMDTTVTIHLTLAQARSLWHELGAVLQSEDHEQKVGKHAAGGTTVVDDYLR